MRFFSFLLMVSLIIFGVIYTVAESDEQVENPRGYYLKGGDTNYDYIYKLT